jgi:hypothetical protein
VDDQAIFSESEAGLQRAVWLETWDLKI